jgi:DNA-binding response OmpR family regulator
MSLPKVLIVEDEAPLANLLVHAFREEDWEVAVARDGIECMNRITGFRPDVIVMDIMMPKLDGIDTTRLIRRNPAHARTVIVALSARHDLKTREEMLAAGADLFFDKPFVMNRLVAQVHDVLVQKTGPVWGRK